MIKSIIIEDEAKARKTLRNVLGDYCTDVAVVAEATDIQSGIASIKEHRPELIFMDIQLPDGEAFRILDEFPEGNFEVIFVTAYTHYLQKAFDYFSFQYLNKPIDTNKLEKAIKKYKELKQPAYSTVKMGMLEKLLKEKNKIITLPHSNGIKILPVSDIIRLEADGSYTKIHLSNESDFVSTKGLGYYENLLSQHGFFRTHKSHLINLKMISNVSFNEGILLKNDEILPLSQTKRKELISVLQLNNI